MNESKEAYMFPTSKKEVDALGWDYIDVILLLETHLSIILLSERHA